MSLADLIRGENVAGRFATATPATFATEEAADGRTVASVATVAVAKSPVLLAKAGCWLVRYPDRELLVVHCSPEMGRAEVLALYPDATGAEPFTPSVRGPSAPMTGEEEATVRAWLAAIGDRDPVSIADIIGTCQRDADARRYFVGLALEGCSNA